MRRLLVVPLIGTLVGAFVVGVLSRLAMMLLARLNPAATGVTSDDGFEMGRFTLAGSANLALVGVTLGLAGSVFYLVLRGLAVGPPWFRLLSLSVGGGVVAGSQIVHSDGVDFTLLEPTWLAFLLFLALPTLYVVLLHVLAERFAATRRDGPAAAWLAGWPGWVLRGGLTVVFVVAVSGIVQDYTTVTG